MTKCPYVTSWDENELHIGTQMGTSISATYKMRVLSVKMLAASCTSNKIELGMIVEHKKNNI